MRRLAVVTYGLSVVVLGCGGAEGHPNPPSPPEVVANPPGPVTPEPPPSAAPSGAPAAAMPEKVDRAKLLLGFIEAFNAGQVDKAVQVMADDGEWVSAGSLVAPATGRAEIARGWTELRDIFKIKVGVRRLILLEGMWVAQGVLLGSHAGDFHGHAATNKPVGVEYVHVGWVENGRLKKLLSLSNGTAFKRQMGVSQGEAPPIPAAPASPEVVEAPGDAKNVALGEALAAAAAKGDLAGWDAAAAPDAVLEQRSLVKSVTGKDAVKKEVTAEAKAFTEVKRDVKSWAAGPYVVSVGTVSAVHSGPYGKIKASKKPVTFHTVEVTKFKDGKAVSVEIYRNPAEILEQIGSPDPTVAKPAAKK